MSWIDFESDSHSQSQWDSVSVLLLKRETERWTVKIEIDITICRQSSRPCVCVFKTTYRMKIITFDDWLFSKLKKCQVPTDLSKKSYSKISSRQLCKYTNYNHTIYTSLNRILISQYLLLRFFVSHYNKSIDTIYSENIITIFCVSYLKFLSPASILVTWPRYVYNIDRVEIYISNISSRLKPLFFLMFSDVREVWYRKSLKESKTSHEKIIIIIIGLR